MKRNILLLVLLALVLLALPLVALAQDVAPSPTVTQPDGVADLLAWAVGIVESQPAVLGIIGFALMQILKFIFPSSTISTELLYGIVLAAVTGVVMVAGALGQSQQVGHVFDVLALFKDGAVTLAGAGLTSSAIYMLATKANNPILAGHQGDKALSFGVSLHG